MASFGFESRIADIPDYPDPGVMFKDITTLLKDSDGFAAAIDSLVERVGARTAGFRFLVELDSFIRARRLRGYAMLKRSRSIM